MSPPHPPTHFFVIFFESIYCSITDCLKTFSLFENLRYSEDVMFLELSWDLARGCTEYNTPLLLKAVCCGQDPKDWATTSGSQGDFGFVFLEQQLQRHMANHFWDGWEFKITIGDMAREPVVKWGGRSFHWASPWAYQKESTWLLAGVFVTQTKPLCRWDSQNYVQGWRFSDENYCQTVKRPVCCALPCVHRGVARCISENKHHQWLWERGCTEVWMK